MKYLEFMSWDVYVSWMFPITHQRNRLNNMGFVMVHVLAAYVVSRGFVIGGQTSVATKVSAHERETFPFFVW